MIQMSREDFKALMKESGREGAREVLCGLGLDGPGAREDIHDLRNLLSAYKAAKATAWQTAIRVMTTAFLVILSAGLAIKLKIVGH